MKILKADPKLHELTFAVYCVGEPDSQNQKIDDVAILEKAASDFEIRFRKNETFFDLDHSGSSIEGVDIIDNYITREPTIIGKTRVEESCWVMKISCSDKLFDLLKDSCSGVSMQGKGTIARE